MKKDDPLLREILMADEEMTAFRADSLTSGLAALRRERRMRQIRRRSLVAAALIALAWAGFANWWPNRQSALPLSSTVKQPVSQSPASSHPTLIAESKPSPTPIPVKIITDQELFALFPNRARALIGVPGHQRFVFLDDKPATRTVKE